MIRFGKPLTDAEVRDLMSLIDGAVREFANVADLGEEPLVCLLWAGRPRAERLHVPPLHTLRRRVAEAKPDAFIAAFKAVDPSGQRPPSTVNVLMRRDGTTSARKFDGTQKSVPCRPPENKGGMLDLLYRGMGDAWRLPVSDEAMIDICWPTDPDTISAVMEWTSRLGGVIDADILRFSAQTASAGLRDMEVEIELRRRVTGREAPLDALYDVLLQDHIGCRWFQCGMPIYELTASFASLLLLTDPAGVGTDCLQLPFPTFFVRLPTPLLRTPLGAKADLSGFWVHAAEMRDAPRWIVRGTVSERTPFGQPRSPTPYGILRDPTRIQPIPCGDWCNTKAVEELSSDPQDIATWRSMLRIFVNLILYLAERKPSPPRQSPPRRRKRGVLEIPRPSIVVLSRDVKPNPTLIAAARAWATSHGPGRTGGWSIHKRFVVAGHRKMQVCGPRLRTPDGTLRWQQRKSIWVEPYVKGEGPLLRHVYIMEQPPG